MKIKNMDKSIVMVLIGVAVILIALLWKLLLIIGFVSLVIGGILWYQKVKVKRVEKEEIKDILQTITVLPLDLESAKISGEIERRLLGENISIDPEDAMIAGIAIKNNQKLLFCTGRLFGRSRFDAAGLSGQRDIGEKPGFGCNCRLRHLSAAGVAGGGRSG